MGGTAGGRLSIWLASNLGGSLSACVCHVRCVPLQAGIASGALASAAVGATNVAGTLIATSLIEGAGRKQLLLSSYLGMAATMALLAAGFGIPSLASYRSVTPPHSLFFAWLLICSVAAGRSSWLYVCAFPSLSCMRQAARASPIARGAERALNLRPTHGRLPASCLPACACSGVIALVGTLGYILSFAIGAGPVTGLIVPEINKEAVRGEGRGRNE